MTDQSPHQDEPISTARHLPACRNAPCEAREWSAKALTGWGMPDLVEDVRTVVTELVTNALQADAREIRAVIERQAMDLVEVRIWDDAPGEPQPQELDLAGESGRGLFLVAALSTSWGHRPGPDGGKTVWARLAPKA